MSKQFFGEVHDRPRIEHTCGKIGYRTRQIAEEARQRAYRREKRELEVYGCPKCGRYHLTSRGLAKPFEDDFTRMDPLVFLVECARSFADEQLQRRPDLEVKVEQAVRRIREVFCLDVAS